jgi:uncharacterized protein YeaO (DUF488 family)
MAYDTRAFPQTPPGTCVAARALLALAPFDTTAAAMAIRIVRLGTPRHSGEGPRLGTVRRAPRGVPKAEFASRDFYDVWFPTLAPSVETMKLAQAAATPAQWAAFSRRYRAEMAAADAAHALELLATMSRHTNFSLGCYCEAEAHCHRSLLRALLAERGASIAPD